MFECNAPRLTADNTRHTLINYRQRCGTNQQEAREEGRASEGCVINESLEFRNSLSQEALGLKRLLRLFSRVSKCFGNFVVPLRRRIMEIGGFSSIFTSVVVIPYHSRRLLFP